MGRTRAHGGGIWGWGGLSVVARTGDVFAATGNALGAPESTFVAERVVRLNAALKFKQSNYPLRPPFPVVDRDFGTAPVLIDARGCQPKLVAINKNGHLYVYIRNHISGGPSQTIRVAVSMSNAIPLYGMPAVDPATRRLVLVSPTPTLRGSRRTSWAYRRSCEGITCTRPWRGGRMDARARGARGADARARDARGPRCAELMSVSRMIHAAA